MGENSDFKRLNYFTGLFLTAKDFSEEQSYLLKKRRLHNRGLHTPGIIAGELQGLRVEAAGGLSVRVWPGAAIDGQGREICLWEPRTLTVTPAAYTLPKLVYVTIAYHDEPSDPVVNVEAPQYSGDARTAEIPVVQIAEAAPDAGAIELARIDLQPGVTTIANAADPANPHGNEIDRRYVAYAGAAAARPPGDTLSPDALSRLILTMQRTRRDFAALEGRFPTPSTADVRQAALTIEIMARLGNLQPDGVASALAALAAIEQDAGQELGADYPNLTGLAEYATYTAAVGGLLAALSHGAAFDPLLTAQDAVAQAARELSEAVLTPPAADAGANQSITAAGADATAALDASGSRAFGGRQVTRYRWVLRSSAKAPVADAGSDRAIVTSGSEATITLDASGSQAPGDHIVTYRWDEKAG